MQDAPNIVILTGAGISAESGLATFRGPDGLWEGHRVENVSTPEALARDPATVHHFYDARRAALASVAPQIGRASCRERVGQYGSIAVFAGALKKKIKRSTKH